MLGVNAGAACLELDRTTWRAGRIVTHVRQLFRGDRFDLVAEFNACAEADSALPATRRVPVALLAGCRPWEFSAVNALKRRKNS